MIRSLCTEAHTTAREKGFHDDSPETPFDDPRYLLSLLMLIGTEVAEAAEEVRKGTPEGFADELADICIRVFDVAGLCVIDLEQAITAKMAANRDRPHRHGGKRV